MATRKQKHRKPSEFSRLATYLSLHSWYLALGFIVGVVLIFGIISPPLLDNWFKANINSQVANFKSLIELGWFGLGIYLFLYVSLAWLYSAYLRIQRQKLLKTQTSLWALSHMTWQEFEELVAEAYRLQGYSVTLTGGGGPDGGYDLTIHKNGQEILVQCKHWKEQVGVKPVRELFGVMVAQNAQGAIVVGLNGFSKQAVSFAQGKPMTLVDGTSLLKLLESSKAKL